MPQVQQGFIITSSEQIAPGIVKGSDIEDGTIEDVDVKSTAAIAFSKLAGVAAKGANSDITSVAGLTTPLTVAQGGTGKNTLTAFLLLVGNVAGVIRQLAIGNAGQVLTSNGAGSDPSFQTPVSGFRQLANVTLTSAGLALDSGIFAGAKFLKVFIYTPGTAGGDHTVILRFNNDAGNNYSRNESTDGAAAATAVNQTSAVATFFNGQDGWFCELEMSNLASAIKQFIGRLVGKVADDTTAATRVEFGGVWNNTSDQITRIKVTGSSNLTIGSKIIVWGSTD